MVLIVQDHITLPFYSSYGGGMSRGSSFSGRFGGRDMGPPQRKYDGLDQPGQRLKKPKWETTELKALEKNFYREHPSVASRSWVRHLCLFWFGYLSNSSHLKSCHILKCFLILLWLNPPIKYGIIMND